MIKDNYPDPCLHCHYSTQSCAYMVDGFNEDDACIAKLRWLKYQNRLLKKLDKKVVEIRWNSLESDLEYRYIRVKTMDELKQWVEKNDKLVVMKLVNE